MHADCSVEMPFTWAHKPRRIVKAQLQKPTSGGGLGLPVFRNVIGLAMPERGFSEIMLQLFLRFRRDAVLPGLL